MRNNVRTTIVIGMIMATVYSAYAVVLYVLRGSAPFESDDTTIWVVLLTYYSAGALGGAVIGALLPLARWRVGRTMLTFLGVSIAILCIEIAMSGPFWHWSGDTWHELMVLTLIFGSLLSFTLPRASNF
jgi:hypothetical protein